MPKSLKVVDLNTCVNNNNNQQDIETNNANVPETSSDIVEEVKTRKDHQEVSNHLKINNHNQVNIYQLIMLKLNIQKWLNTNQ